MQKVGKSKVIAHVVFYNFVFGLKEIVLKKIVQKSKMKSQLSTRYSTRCCSYGSWSCI